MIDWLLAGLCLFSGALIVYHHAAYPLLLRWYAKSHPARQIEESHRCYKDEQQDCTLPTITILESSFERFLPCHQYNHHKQ